MSTVDALAGTSLRPASTLAPAQSEDPQDTFMQLMIAQLRHQDPLNPQDGAEFLSQLAQFETASGIRSLQKTVSDYAGAAREGQALAAAALVGRDALVQADTAVLASGGAVAGAAELAAPGPLTVTVYDTAGNAVRRLDAGTAPAGINRFVWDGRTDAGTPAPAGTYRLYAQTGSGTGAPAVPVLLAGRVEGVSLPPGGTTTLHLTGAGPVALSSLRAVY